MSPRGNIPPGECSVRDSRAKEGPRAQELGKDPWVVSGRERGPHVRTPPRPPRGLVQRFADARAHLDGAGRRARKLPERREGAGKEHPGQGVRMRIQGRLLGETHGSRRSADGEGENRKERPARGRIRLRVEKGPPQGGARLSAGGLVDSRIMEIPRLDPHPEETGHCFTGSCPGAKEPNGARGRKEGSDQPDEARLPDGGHRAGEPLGKDSLHQGNGRARAMAQERSAPVAAEVQVPRAPVVVEPVAPRPPDDGDGPGATLHRSSW